MSHKYSMDDDYLYSVYALVWPDKLSRKDKEKALNIANRVRYRTGKGGRK